MKGGKKHKRKRIQYGMGSRGAGKPPEVPRDRKVNFSAKGSPDFDGNSERGKRNFESCRGEKSEDLSLHCKVSRWRQ